MAAGAGPPAAGIGGGQAGSKAIEVFHETRLHWRFPLAHFILSGTGPGYRGHPCSGWGSVIGLTGIGTLIAPKNGIFRAEAVERIILQREAQTTKFPVG